MPEQPLDDNSSLASHGAGSMTSGIEMAGSKREAANKISFRGSLMAEEVEGDMEFFGFQSPEESCHTQGVGPLWAKAEQMQKSRKLQ